MDSAVRAGAVITRGLIVAGTCTIQALKGVAMGRPPPGELSEMKRAVPDAMEDGAFGIASALILEEAVRKMTSAVANRLSLADRGVLREGMLADVVVFDPATILDKATFEEPHQLSVGVEHVFVNGVAVLSDGKHTGAKPGRVVRGPGYRKQ